jgi:hypothetical protein
MQFLNILKKKNNLTGEVLTCICKYQMIYLYRRVTGEAKEKENDQVYISELSEASARNNYVPWDYVPVSSNSNWNWKVVKKPKGKLPAGIAEIPGYVVKWCSSS